MIYSEIVLHLKQLGSTKVYIILLHPANFVQWIDIFLTLFLFTLNNYLILIFRLFFYQSHHKRINIYGRNGQSYK